jgi:hypothetical protein
MRRVEGTWGTSIKALSLSIYSKPRSRCYCQTMTPCRRPGSGGGGVRSRKNGCFVRAGIQLDRLIKGGGCGYGSVTCVNLRLAGAGATISLIVPMGRSYGRACSSPHVSQPLKQSYLQQAARQRMLAFYACCCSCYSRASLTVVADGSPPLLALLRSRVSARQLHVHMIAAVGSVFGSPRLRVATTSDRRCSSRVRIEVGGPKGSVGSRCLG